MSTNRICIIDPASHIPSLKLLFPEAEYFSHQPDHLFHYSHTHHYSQSQIESEYGFKFRTDWETIHSDTFDTVFIVAPLLDYYKGLTPSFTAHLSWMKRRIQTLLETGSFKKVVLFDIYDYDYDPSEINTDWKVDFYFKRNYQTTKAYAANVFPFPYIMFVKPCVLKMCLSTSPSTYSINRAFWCGGLYDHSDPVNHVFRPRQQMYNQISKYIDTIPHCSYDTYLATMRSYKIGVDLIGVGDPNKRTLELLHHGVLMMTMCTDLAWGFEEGDSFHPDTLFKTADEFCVKLQRLLTDEEHYKQCYTQQMYITSKYFNKEWLRHFLCAKAGL